MSVGTHPITAVYGGDPTYTGSTSAALTETVQQPTSYTSLSVNPATSAPGQSVTFTASVSGAGGTAPTGSVNFYDGGTLLGSGSLVAGGMGAQATFGMSSLSLGGHFVTAVYAGDPTYAGSISSVVTETVQPNQPTTTTSLTSSSLTSFAGMSLTFTATVTKSGTGATPSGTVTFYDGSASLGSVAVSSSMGQAALTISTLSVGSHSITAVYSGDSIYSGSTSAAVGETVQLSSSMEMLSSSNSSSAFGQPVTFTASIMTGSPGVAATGTVSFYDNGVLLAIVTLNNGMMGQQAALTTSSLSHGSHTITATYSGDGNFAGSSASLTEFVF